MNVKIINGNLLLREEDKYKVTKETLFIKNNEILQVGGKVANENDFAVFDANDKLLMPGLINMHTHAYMTFLRNYADDVEFDEWLFKRVMPVEDNMPLEAAYWSSLLGYMEMFMTGTTSFVDMHMYLRQAPKAAKQAGIRSFIGRGLVGEDLYTDGYSRFNDSLIELEEYGSDMINIVLSPHAIYTASPRIYEQVAEECRKRNLLKQTHLSETVGEVENCIKQHGKTPVELMRDLGFLDEKTILAHCVQMRGDDMAIIAESGATVVTNPASNAKLGNGFAPVVELAAAGCNVALGTDGTASNNTLNMFREMGLLTMIQKGIHKSPTVAPARFCLDTATINGAKGLGMQDKLGVIKAGAKADIIFIDLNEVSLFPNNDIVTSLVYSANGSEVKDVMVNGEFVMKNRELLTIDKEEVYFNMKKIVAENL